MLISLICVSCSSLPELRQGQDAVGHLDFLTRAQAADARGRDHMWRELRDADAASPDAVLQSALLQSLPGHAGTDVPAARQKLRRLTQSHYPLQVALLARLRIQQLQELQQSQRLCREENEDLRRRLEAVVDIERESEQSQEVMP